MLYLTLASRFFLSVQQSRTEATYAASESAGCDFMRLSSPQRSAVLRRLAFNLERERHPDARLLPASKTDAFSWRRVVGGDPPRDVRVACKSAKMRWCPSRRLWVFGVSMLQPDAYDVVHLALYTPGAIHVFQHDGRLGVFSSGGQLGWSDLKLSAPKGILGWKAALDLFILPAIGAGFGEGGEGGEGGEAGGEAARGACEMLATVAYDDPRLASAIETVRRPKPWLDYEAALASVPLGLVSLKARSQALESLARQLDEELHPTARFSTPPRAGAAGATYSWLRDGTRVVCRSSSLRWERTYRRWFLEYNGLPLGEPLDELQLAIYTPDGVHIYRHDQALGVCTEGRRGARAAGSSPTRAVKLYGSLGEEAWRSALRRMLEKLDGSSCERLGHIRWSDVALAEDAAPGRAWAPDEVPRLPS